MQLIAVNVECVAVVVSSSFPMETDVVAGIRIMPLQLDPKLMQSIAVNLK
jgi:hypothetical protein